jgi:hypothetical protein
MTKVIGFIWATVATSLLAGGFAVDQGSFTGGGGSGSGGRFSVAGSVQPMAPPTLRSSTYTISGGFWSAATLVQTPGAPALTVKREDNSGLLAFSWAATADGYAFEESPTLTGPVIPWTAVSPQGLQTNGITISISIPVQPGTRFFRLRKP